MASQSYDLEVITRGVPPRSQLPSLLFIHGGFHAAWCWDVHFLNWFAGQGFEVHAVSLRGHGRSGPRRGINRWRLNDYVADARRAAGTLTQPPILIGHSLGAHVAMRLQSEIKAPALILIAPSPPHGTQAVRARLIKSHPLSLTLALMTGNLCFAKRAFASFFFRDALPRADRARYMAKLDCESASAVQDVLGGKDPADPNRVDCPALVIAGAHDWSIPLPVLEETAQALRAELTVTDGAHDLMLDPAWEKTATAMLEWLLANKQRIDTYRRSTPP